MFQLAIKAFFRSWCAAYMKDRYTYYLYKKYALINYRVNSSWDALLRSFDVKGARMKSKGLIDVHRADFTVSRL